MRRLTATIIGISPLSFTHKYDAPRLDGETAEAFDKRTWQGKLHVNAQNEVFIPHRSIEMSMKNAVKFAYADMWRDREMLQRVRDFVRPENGTFSVGPEEIVLNAPAHDDEGTRVIRSGDVQGEQVYFMPRGGTTHSPFTFPLIPKGWIGTIEINVSEKTNLYLQDWFFEELLANAGTNVGIGRWRAESGGLYGRFKVEDKQWQITNR